MSKYNKTQTFITTTELTDINLSKIDEYSIYQVIEGKIEESDNNG